MRKDRLNGFQYPARYETPSPLPLGGSSSTTKKEAKGYIFSRLLFHFSRLALTNITSNYLSKTTHAG